MDRLYPLCVTLRFLFPDVVYGAGEGDFFMYVRKDVVLFFFFMSLVTRENLACLCLFSDK